VIARVVVLRYDDVVLLKDTEKCDLQILKGISYEWHSTLNNLIPSHSIIIFVILLAISELIRRFYTGMPKFSTLSGSIVMAIGIFSLDTLQQLPFVNPFISQLISVELFVIWLYLVQFYINSYLSGSFNTYIKSLSNQFGIGTWVAGCSVLGILLITEMPSWYIIIWTVALLAFVIWLFYLKIILVNLMRIVKKQKQIHTGIILLSTVSTQSIVLLFDALSILRIPVLINQTLIICGYLFYIIGMLIIARHYLSIKLKRVILSWSSSNSIIHGALSITGLASTLTRVMSEHIIVYTWLLATCFFILVETISLIKLSYRIKLTGWKQGVFIYDLSQWSRIFTYGMYYAFTLSIVNHHLFDHFVAGMIAQYGQYVVFLLLLFEVILFLYTRMIRYRIADKK